MHYEHEPVQLVDQLTKLTPTMTRVKNARKRTGGRTLMPRVPWRKAAPMIEIVVTWVPPPDSPPPFSALDLNEQLMMPCTEGYGGTLLTYDYESYMTVNVTPVNRPFDC